jgi:hypothetical protein
MIHLDEKYFYLNKITRKVYLSSKEDEEINRGEYVQHKSHRTKCMFLIAVARPRLSRAGTKVSTGATLITANHPIFEGDSDFEDGVKGNNGGTDNITATGQAHIQHLSQYHKEVFDKDFLYEGIPAGNNKIFNFDGLVSLIPIVTTRQQQRKTKKHDKGEIIWEPLSMDQKIFEDKFLNILLDDIKKLSKRNA